VIWHRPARASDAAGGLTGVQQLRHYQRSWLRGDVIAGVTVAAYLVPQVMAYAGVAGVPPVAGLWAAAALFIVFAIAMALNLLRGRTHIDCGCFQSALRQPLEWRLVVRNVVLALLAACSSLASDGGGWSRDVALMAVPAGITLYALYTALNTVWALDDSARTAFPRLRS